MPREREMLIADSLLDSCGRDMNRTGSIRDEMIMWPSCLKGDTITTCLRGDNGNGH